METYIKFIMSSDPQEENKWSPKVTPVKKKEIDVLLFGEHVIMINSVKIRYSKACI